MKKNLGDLLMFMFLYSEEQWLDYDLFVNMLIGRSVGT